jgi:flagellar basal body-associated protein FliL
MRLIAACLLIAAVTVLAPLPAGAAEKGEKKKGGGESFIQFPTLTASLRRPGGRRGVLTVEAGVDVADAGLRARAQSSIPRLRDAYFRYLSTYAATVPPGAPPNPDAIALALQRSTDQVLGKPGAKLLLGTVLIN